MLSDPNKTMWMFSLKLIALIVKKVFFCCVYIGDNIQPGSENWSLQDETLWEKSLVLTPQRESKRAQQAAGPRCSAKEAKMHQLNTLQCSWSFYKRSSLCMPHLLKWFWCSTYTLQKSAGSREAHLITRHGKFQDKNDIWSIIFFSNVQHFHNSLNTYYIK